MSAIIDLEVDTVLGLDEFCAHVIENAAIKDRESLVEHSWALRALANNRHFVLDAYHRELEAICSNKSFNEHQPQSLSIRNFGDFYIRANIWLPIETGKRTEDFEKRLFAFDLAHDHNFSFLTVGYFGAGYETDIYIATNMKSV